ncbi:MAG: hypothetical protein ABIA59_05500, partial [Candidatus Latescibacterota bacterium]
MQPKTNPPPTRRATFVKVAIPIPVDTLFTYEVPEEYSACITVGSRVEVPLGRRVMGGVVFELADKSDFQPTRSIRAVSDVRVSPQLLELARWIASYYGCSRGEAAQALLPPRVTKAKNRKPLEGNVKLTDPPISMDEMEHAFARAARQLALLKTLLNVGGVAPLDIVCGEWGYTRTAVRQ